MFAAGMDTGSPSTSRGSRTASTVAPLQCAGKGQTAEEGRGTPKPSLHLWPQVVADVSAENK